MPIAPFSSVKPSTPDDMPRLEAVRAGAPAARIIVDANEGWTPEIHADLAPHLQRLGVVLVEQSLPAGQDDALRGMERPVSVCADESCHDRARCPICAASTTWSMSSWTRPSVWPRALALRDAARAEGHAIMAGCGVGSSLAMAPAMLVAQGAMVTDLDSPLLLAVDRTPPLAFDAAGRGASPGGGAVGLAGHA